MRSLERATDQAFSELNRGSLRQVVQEVPRDFQLVQVLKSVHFYFNLVIVGTFQLVNSHAQIEVVAAYARCLPSRVVTFCLTVAKRKKRLILLPRPEPFTYVAFFHLLLTHRCFCVSSSRSALRSSSKHLFSLAFNTPLTPTSHYLPPNSSQFGYLDLEELRRLKYSS